MEVQIPTSRGYIASVLNIVDAGSPVVVLCHGFRATMDMIPLTIIESFLNSHGYSTLKFDFGNGIGKSYGEIHHINIYNQLEDLHDVVSYLKKDYSKIGIIGHSLGGFSAAHYLSEYNNLDALVLLSAPFDYVHRGIKLFGEENYMKILDGKLKISDLYHLIRKNTVFDVGTQFYEDILKYSPNDFKKIKTPTLIVNGEEDKVVVTSQGQKYDGRLNSEHSFLTIPGADHNFTDASSAKVMCENIKRFLDRYMK